MYPAGVEFTGDSKDMRVVQTQRIIVEAPEEHIVVTYINDQSAMKLYCIPGVNHWPLSSLCTSYANCRDIYITTDYTYTYFHRLLSRPVLLFKIKSDCHEDVVRIVNDNIYYYNDDSDEDSDNEYHSGISVASMSRLLNGEKLKDVSRNIAGTNRSWMVESSHTYALNDDELLISDKTYAKYFAGKGVDLQSASALCDILVVISHATGSHQLLYIKDGVILERRDSKISFAKRVIYDNVRVRFPGSVRIGDFMQFTLGNTTYSITNDPSPAFCHANTPSIFTSTTSSSDILSRATLRDRIERIQPRESGVRTLQYDKSAYNYAHNGIQCITTPRLPAHFSDIDVYIDTEDD